VQERGGFGTVGGAGEELLSPEVVGDQVALLTQRAGDRFIGPVCGRITCPSRRTLQRAGTFRSSLSRDLNPDLVWWRANSRRVIQRQHLESRSEEHTSELQSQSNLVCRLL